MVRYLWKPIKHTNWVTHYWKWMLGLSTVAQYNCIIIKYLSIASLINLGQNIYVLLTLSNQFLLTMKVLHAQMVVVVEIERKEGGTCLSIVAILVKSNYCLVGTVIKCLRNVGGIGLRALVLSQRWKNHLSNDFKLI